MIVFRYCHFGGLLCQNGFPSFNVRRILRPGPVFRRTFRTRRVKGPEPAPAPAPKRPQSSRTWRNASRIGLFTVVGVAGGFETLTRLDAADLRSRFRAPYEPREPPNLFRRLWSQMPSLTLDRLMYGIMGTCAAIFVGWHIPRLLPIMNRYFVGTLKSRAPIRGLTLSTYSHQNVLHLAINMLCFFSFTHNMNHYLTPKHLLFFIWSAGLMTGCGSLLVNALLRGSVPSLGISAILFAFMSFICVKAPDSQFLLFFVAPLTGEQLLTCFIIFDLCGLLFFHRTSFIDHAGHLAGTAFGAFYAHFGQGLYLNRVMTHANLGRK